MYWPTCLRGEAHTANLEVQRARTEEHRINAEIGYERQEIHGMPIAAQLEFLWRKHAMATAVVEPNAEIKVEQVKAATVARAAAVEPHAETEVEHVKAATMVDTKAVATTGGVN